MFKNLIFDWSGTLADDLPFVFEATNDVLREHGREPFTLDEFREKFFMPFTEFYETYLPEVELAQLEHYYHTSFKMLQEQIPLLPHALEILKFAKKEKMKVFLLSAIHPEHFDVQAERLGVKKYFTRAYTGAIDKRKTILNLLAEHDLDPRETMFVGDMEHDIDTAKHGGVTSCAVLTGYDTLKKIKRSAPDLLFRDMDGLLNYLKRHRDEPAEAPVVTVGGLIQNADGQWLMLQTHKWSNLWGMPGGKVKFGETAEAALKRELKEETGLDVTDVEFVMLQDCIQPEEFFKPAHFILLCYQCWTKSTRVRLNEEAEHFQWITTEEAFSLDLNQPTRTLLERIAAASGA